MMDGQSNPASAGQEPSPSEDEHHTLDPRLLDATIRVGALAFLWLLLVMARLLATHAGA